MALRLEAEVPGLGENRVGAKRPHLEVRDPRCLSLTQEVTLVEQVGAGGGQGVMAERGQRYLRGKGKM